MAHEDRRAMSKITDANVDELSSEQKQTLQQLAEANLKIEELELQIAWLRCSYE